jgi:hypothetical protein
MSLRSSKWFQGVAIGTVVVAVLLLGARAAMHVSDGEAADTYTNVKGVHISWGSAFVFVAAMVLALAVAFAMRWWHGRAERGLVDPTVDNGSSSEEKLSGVFTNLRSNTSLERTREG